MAPHVAELLQDGRRSQRLCRPPMRTVGRTDRHGVLIAIPGHDYCHGTRLRGPTCPVRRLGIELGKHLSDYLRGLMRRQRRATFDLGDLDGEILDRMDAADEDVAQGLATPLRIRSE